MAAGSTYTPIATQTVSGSSTSVVQFTSIPQGYTDLVLVVNGNATINDDVTIQLGNGSIDTGSNYSYTGIYGNGSSAASIRTSNDTSGKTGGIYGTAVGNLIVSFQNYSNTTTYKSFLSRANGTAYVQARVNLWRSTSAINIMNVGTGAGYFTAGSTFTLYGIVAA